MIRKKQLLIDIKPVKLSFLNNALMLKSRLSAEESSSYRAEVNATIIQILRKDQTGERSFFCKYLGMDKRNNKLSILNKMTAYDRSKEVEYLFINSDTHQTELWILNVFKKNGIPRVQRILQVYRSRNDDWQNVTNSYYLLNDYNAPWPKSNGSKPLLRTDENTVVFVQTWGADRRHRPDTEQAGQIGSLLSENGFEVIHASRFFLEGETVRRLDYYQDHIEWWKQHVVDLIAKNRARYACLSIYDNTMLFSVELMKVLRREFGDAIIIIIGGPGVSSFSIASTRLGEEYGLWQNPAFIWESKNRPLHDIAVPSPNGHGVLLKVLCNIKSEHPIPGSESILSGRLKIGTLTPAPNWSHMPVLDVARMLEHYPDEQKNRPFFSFTLHQECPAFWNQCLNFCSGQRSLYMNIDGLIKGQKYRGVSPEKIARDMLAIIDFAGARFLFPSAPDITPPHILKNIHKAVVGNPRLRRMAAQGEFKIGAFARLSNLMRNRDKILRIMKDINMREIYLGFENLKYWMKSSSAIENNEKKMADYLNNVEDCFMKMKNAGIKVEVNTVYGFSGETIDDAMITINWIYQALDKGILSSDLTMTAYSDLHTLEVPYSAYSKKDLAGDSPYEVMIRIGNDYPPAIAAELVLNGEIDLKRLCKPHSKIERHILPRLGLAIRQGIISRELIPDVPYGESEISYRDMADLFCKYLPE